MQQPPQSPQLPSVFDLASDPSMPVAPHRGENGADPLNESELIHQVVRALRIAVEKFPDSCRVEASSAAFHAEPLLRRLCEEFEDPVRSVAISADNFVVVRVKATDASKFKPRFVIGPPRGGRISPSQRRLQHKRIGRVLSRTPPDRVDDPKPHEDWRASSRWRLIRSQDPRCATWTPELGRAPGKEPQRQGSRFCQVVGPQGFEPWTDGLKVSGSSFKTAGKLQGKRRSQATYRPKPYACANVEPGTGLQSICAKRRVRDRR